MKKIFSFKKILRCAQNDSKSGFTLTELLIVIALSAILFGLTVPAVVTMYQRQLVDDTAYTLRELLIRSHTQTAAGLEGSAFGVKIQSDALTLFKGTSYATRDASWDDRREYPNWIQVAGPTDEIVFSPYGATTTVNGSILITGGSASHTLMINSYGAIDLR